MLLRQCRPPHRQRCDAEFVMNFCGGLLALTLTAWAAMMTCEIECGNALPPEQDGWTRIDAFFGLSVPVFAPAFQRQLFSSSRPIYFLSSFCNCAAAFDNPDRSSVVPIDLGSSDEYGAAFDDGLERRILLRKHFNVVSQREWDTFLEAEIAPRLVDGFTVASAEGISSASTRPQHEPAKIISVIYQNSKACEVRQNLSEVAELFKWHFHQKCVLLSETRLGGVAFI